MIAVFAYAFAHRKTHDFLVELALAGHRQVTVLAAPFEKLKSTDTREYYKKSLRPAPALDTGAIAHRLGFDFIEIPHQEIALINDIIRNKDLRLGIISGARILKPQIIDSFSDGIVNFHPGKIPETSGLGAFFYTLKTNSDAGVTTHFIDARVDAGQFLNFDAIDVLENDDIQSIIEKTYHQQIVSLRRFLSGWENGTLSPKPIHRPAKNIALTPEEKTEIVSSFPIWRAGRIVCQDIIKLHKACETGDTSQIKHLLDRHPYILEQRSPEGWSPLIIACFHQQMDAAAVLLESGADANATGRKGTTVLMYAKTALLDQKTPNFDLLELLIHYGADPARRDCFGKSILDYLVKPSVIVDYFHTKGD